MEAAQEMLMILSRQLCSTADFWKCASTEPFSSVLLCSAVGIICAAPGLDGAWLRAQVISYFEDTSEVELRYVDYGGYDKVKVDTLRQIRSATLPWPEAVSGLNFHQRHPQPLNCL